MKNKLFLICPNSYLEETIKQNFEGNIYFLTALGAVFNHADDSLTENINYLIAHKKVQEIFVVNDTQCQFISNAITGSKNFNTKAERLLEKLLLENRYQLALEKNKLQKCKELAKLSLQKEVLALKNSVLKHQINEGEVKLSPLLYDREAACFNALQVEAPLFQLCEN